MSQSGYCSQNSEDLKDQVSNAADAVQQTSVDAYELVRDTAQEQPFISGMLVGALVGFALGALWKLESRRSLLSEPVLRAPCGPDWATCTGSAAKPRGCQVQQLR